MNCEVCAKLIEISKGNIVYDKVRHLIFHYECYIEYIAALKKVTTTPLVKIKQ